MNFSTSDSAAKLIFGCGYLGRRVAQAWLQTGQLVFVVTRSDEKAQELAKMGLTPIVADVNLPHTLRNLPTTRTVLFSVGYDRNSTQSIGEVYRDGLSHALEALPKTTGRLIYVSTTGVFGQTNGDWVDEDSPCCPTRSGGQAALAAEQVLAAHPLGERSIVLRPAGIYGPGRIPRRDDLEAGRPIPCPDDGYLNLIHVDDLVAAVLAAETCPMAPRLYLISDGHPVLRRDYYRELARLLKAPPPVFEAPPADSPAGQRATADKRVNSARAIRELRLSLKYPSYCQGLAALVTGG